MVTFPTLSITQEFKWSNPMLTSTLWHRPMVNEYSKWKALELQLTIEIINQN